MQCDFGVRTNSGPLGKALVYTEHCQESSKNQTFPPSSSSYKNPLLMGQDSLRHDRKILFHQERQRDTSSLECTLHKTSNR